MYKTARDARHYKFNNLSEIHYKNCVIKKKNNDINYLKNIIHNLEKNNRDLSIKYNTTKCVYADLMDAYVTLENNFKNVNRDVNKDNNSNTTESLTVNVPVTPQSNKIIGM
tara:strand:+ start:346 stop:678 length:333 start_codon:yes stop_codon:yes gene_type:complete